MKTISSLSVLVLGLGVSASVFAAESSGRGGGSPGSSMTLQDLKGKCMELSANEQLKPFKAVVSCKQVTTEWRPAAQSVDPVKIQNTKQIGASFSLKGYAVPFQIEQIEVSPSEAACHLLEQYTITVPAVDLELDCSALTQVQNLADLCSPAIEERVSADPGIAIEEATGESFNTCTGQQVIQGPQRPQQSRG